MMVEFTQMLEVMLNGNWAEAIARYKSLNITARKFQELLTELNDEELRDIALLGFYAKDS